MRNVLSIAQRGHQHSTGQNPELFDDLVVVFSGMTLVFNDIFFFFVSFLQARKKGVLSNM